MVVRKRNVIDGVIKMAILQVLLFLSGKNYKIYSMFPLIELIIGNTSEISL